MTVNRSGPQGQTLLQLFFRYKSVIPSLKLLHRFPPCIKSPTPYFKPNFLLFTVTSVPLTSSKSAYSKVRSNFFINPPALITRGYKDDVTGAEKKEMKRRERQPGEEENDEITPLQRGEGAAELLTALWEDFC